MRRGGNASAIAADGGVAFVDETYAARGITARPEPSRRRQAPISAGWEALTLRGSQRILGLYSITTLDMNAAAATRTPAWPP
jgi:hypothetical protein